MPPGKRAKQASKQWASLFGSSTRFGSALGGKISTVRYVDNVLNGSDDTLGAWLIPRLDAAELVAIRTGFLSLPAVDACLSGLKALLERGGTLEIVTGGDGEQADPDALRRLLELTSDHETACVRVVIGAEFHNAKTYYVRYPDQRAEAWVGSANLTHAGLHSNHEAAVTLDTTEDDPKAVTAVVDAIQAYQNGHGTVRLTDNVIRQLTPQPLTAGQGTSRTAAVNPTVFWEEILQPTMDVVDNAASHHPQNPDHLPTLPTGLTDLDTVLGGGLRSGSVTVIASRPSVGRTTLLLDIVRHAAIEQAVLTAVFSLELPAMELSQRILAAEARIRVADMRGGRMTDDEWTRMAKRMTATSEAPLMINTTPAAHLDALVQEITRLDVDYAHTSMPLGLVAIDSLSLLTVPVATDASREREVSVAIRRLKAVALEHDIAVVLTAELNRASENRADHRPQLGDLRDSDSIAQVADNVILIHRPDAWERDDPRMGEADLILAKHRQGPPATVTVAHQLHYSRFVTMAPAPD